MLGWTRQRWIGAGAAILVVGVTACSGGGDGDKADKKADAGADAEQESRAERAPAGLVQVLLPEDVEATVEPLSGAVGTETTRVSLVGTASVDEIGRGRAARRPAEDEKFVVVEVETQQHELSAVTFQEQAEMEKRGAATLSVLVGDARPVAVSLDAPSYSPLPIDLDSPPIVPAPGDPKKPQRRLLVMSVPSDTETIDLLVVSGLPEQRISLVTGDPAPGNMAVLARQNRVMPAAVAQQSFGVTRTEFGASQTETLQIGVSSASLEWTAGAFGPATASGPDRAILQVAMDTGGFNLARSTELRLPDGTVLQPLPVEGGDEIVSGIDPTVRFEVPADFSAGTLVFGKDYSWDVPTGGTMAADFDTPLDFPITIPLTQTP